MSHAHVRAAARDLCGEIHPLGATTLSGRQGRARPLDAKWIACMREFVCVLVFGPTVLLGKGLALGRSSFGFASAGEPVSQAHLVARRADPQSRSHLPCGRWRSRGFA